MKRLIKKAERSLTNIEYEELKAIIEKNKGEVLEVEIIPLLEKLKEMDQGDPYVLDLVKQVFDLLISKWKFELAAKYHSDFSGIEDRMEAPSEDTREPLTSIKKVSDYIRLGGTSEQYIDKILSPFVGEINEWDESNLAPSLTDFCKANLDMISEEFLFKYYDYIYLSNLVYSQGDLPEKILDKMISDPNRKILLSNIIARQNVSEKLIFKYNDLIFNDERCLSSLIYNEKLDLSSSTIVKIVKSARHKLDSDDLRQLLLSKGNQLSDQDINELFRLFNYQDFAFICLRITKEAEDYLINKKQFFDDLTRKSFFNNVISKNYFVDEDFIERNKDDLNINTVLEKNKNLTEEFIEQNIDKMTAEAWNNVSQNSNLSEGFIWENKEDVNWERISRFQKLSAEFILGKAMKYVNPFYLDGNSNINQQEMKRKKVYELLKSFNYKR